MTEVFGRVIHTYGKKMTCCNAAGELKGEVVVIVQPMTEADWQYTAGALGSCSAERFLGLAAPEIPSGGLNMGDRLAVGQESYEVMTVRPIWVGGRITHYWMALRPAEEAAV